MHNRFIGRYNQGSTDDIINRVEEIATKKGVSMAQVAIAWVLSKEGVTAPIVGSTNLEHLKDILGEHEARSANLPRVFT
jgi:aryl-alcohol dehydrogenase-like predicted oxidoreductase